MSLYNLPSEYWYLSVHLKIGDSFGELQMVDDKVLKGCWGTYAQFCIKVDISKPLPKIITVVTNNCNWGSLSCVYLLSQARTLQKNSVQIWRKRRERLGRIRNTIRSFYKLDFLILIKSRLLWDWQGLDRNEDLLLELDASMLLTSDTWSTISWIQKADIFRKVLLLFSRKW